MKTLDILAFGAHPDDVELGCGGSLAKAVASGKKVGIIDLTQGELGTRGTAAIRAKESKYAAELLGVEFRSNLEFRDGFFVNDEIHQRHVIQQLRTHRPEIVLCNAIHDRHIDHGRGSALVKDAAFLSGLARIETKGPDGALQQPWRPRLLLHYIQWEEIQPDIVLDISGFLEAKMQAVQAYKSQFFDPNSSAPNTPISSENFLESVRYRARNLGRLLDLEAGEGFTVDRLIGVADFDSLI
ncbi:MAG: bacillithiol biosynthesis deacetylase BshB1 [Flavobacteriaceae bacterium]